MDLAEFEPEVSMIGSQPGMRTAKPGCASVAKGDGVSYSAPARTRTGKRLVRHNRGCRFASNHGTRLGSVSKEESRVSYLQARKNAGGKKVG